VPERQTSVASGSIADRWDSLVLRLRIFVSSPSDVGAERAVALAVTERLQLEFRGQVELEAFLWERSLLRATNTFQAQILDVQEHFEL
jgi:hypothetical protein